MSFANFPMGSISSKPFSPLDLSPYIWVRADDVTITSGVLVDSMNDKSGNSRDLAQTSTNRPDLLTADAGFNDQDAVDFNPQESLVLASLTLAQPFTVFAAIRANTWTTNKRLFDLNSSNATLMIANKDGASTPNVIQGVTVPNEVNAVSMTVGTEFLLTSVFDGASASQQLNNNTAVTGGSTGTTALNKIQLANRTDNATGADVTIAELIIIPSAVTGDDLASMQGYFNARYSFW